MYPNNPQNYPGSNMYPSLSPGSARTIICYSANFADPYTGNVPYSPVPGALAVNAQSAFIRKVYLMLSLQLAVVAAMVLLAMYSWSFKLFVLNIVTLAGVSFGLLVLSLAISCYFGAIRHYQIPVYIIFTALEGILVSAVTSRYPAGIVTLAALMTAVLVIVLTIYAFTTNTNFTGCGPYLTIGLVVMLFFGLFTMFFRTPFTTMLYSALIVLLFGAYLIYDTQQVSARFGTFYSMDDYFLASLSLFIDIIQLFLNILNLVGSNR